MPVVDRSRFLLNPSSALCPKAEPSPIQPLMTASDCGFNWSLQHLISRLRGRRVLPMKKYRKRSPFSESDKAVMWDRWFQGDSLHAIARLWGASHTSVRRHLLATGGIRPVRRHRSTLALSLSEREQISRGIVAGHSIRCIARTLGRAPCTNPAPSGIFAGTAAAQAANTPR